MTPIKSGSKLQRETALHYRGRALVVQLSPGYLTVRQKGTRTAYSVSYDAIYTLGAKLKAASDRREKQERKKSRK